MPSGYCPTCQRLVTIVPREPRRVDKGIPSSLSGQREWYPVKHPASNTDTGGEDCPGIKKAVQ